MSTSGTERFCKLCLMLMEVGTKASLILLLKQLGVLCPGWTIDDFLKSKEKELKNLSKYQYKALLPGKEKIDLTKWDLSRICFVLKHLCNLESKIHLDVRHLHDIRNNLSHKTHPTVDENEYQNLFEDLKVITARMVRSTGDAEQEEEITQMMDKIYQGTLSFDTTIQKMHSFYLMETFIREKLENVEEVSEQILEKVQQLDSMVANISERLTQSDKKVNSRDSVDGNEASGAPVSEQILEKVQQLDSMVANISERLTQSDKKVNSRDSVDGNEASGAPVSEQILEKVQQLDSMVANISERLTQSDKKVNSRDSVDGNEASGAPGLEVECFIELTDISEESKANITPILVQIFEDVRCELDNSEPKKAPDSYTNLRQAVRNLYELFLSKGWRIGRVREKCIMLYIKSTSYASLASLLRQCNKGEISAHLDGVRKELSSMEGAENVKLEFFIYRDEFLNVIDKITNPDTADLQTVALLEMYRAQRSVAHFLELAILYLPENEQIAQKVYKAADLAYDLHKKLVRSKQHERLRWINRFENVPDMICTNQILKKLEYIKEDLERHRKYYTKLQNTMKEVIDECENAKKTEHQISPEGNTLDGQSTQFVRFAKDERTRAKKTIDKKVKLQTTITQGASMIPDEMKDPDTKSDLTQEIDEIEIFSMLRPGIALTGGISASNWQMNSLEGIFRMFCPASSCDQFSALAEGYIATENEKQSSSGKRPLVLVKMYQHCQDALSRFEALQNSGKFCGEECLKEVHLHLKYLDVQLARQIDSFSEMMSAIHMFIEKPNLFNLDLEHYTRIYEEWSLVAKMYSCCQTESKRQLNNLYSFVLTKEKTTSVKVGLKSKIREIKEEISKTYPSTIHD